MIFPLGHPAYRVPMLRSALLVVGFLLLGVLAAWSFAHAPVRSYEALSIEQRGL